MRTLVYSVKTIVESHRHVSLSVAFPGYPPQKQQPCQHVAEGQIVFFRSSRYVAPGKKVTEACETPSGIHKISFKGSTTLPLYKSGTSDFHIFSPALSGHKKHKYIRRGKRGKNKTIGKSTNQLCNIYYVCIYVYVYVYVHVYMYICIYVYMYICIYVYMYICIYVYMYICIYVYMYICID